MPNSNGIAIYSKFGLYTDGVLRYILGQEDPVELLTKFAWGALALIHLMPSVPLFRPKMIETLYGVEPSGDIGVLLTHRSGLFLAILVTSVFALLSVEARRLASVVLAVSMISFLILYVRAGLPVGPLKKIAIADAIDLVPLAFVIWQAWFVK